MLKRFLLIKNDCHAFVISSSKCTAILVDYKRYISADASYNSDAKSNDKFIENLFEFLMQKCFP